ncbi:hypothetical protein JRQ81_005786 [Phrynocephalus forsythii]|uniref:Shieldin complex subunit 1 C-terminal domain-containing protein n=1 Tax=Phrynocephalus forsythii TaxID=171643 RepID=A0A9Q0Y359_9SAUR|nr:hypothetical protein JRQ81_005786 [Phrynocephalus forsythii]
MVDSAFRPSKGLYGPCDKRGKKKSNHLSSLLSARCCCCPVNSCFKIHEREKWRRCLVRFEYPSSIDLTGNTSGADITLCPTTCEKIDPVNGVSTEPFPPGEGPSSWTYEQRDEGEPTIRKSLDRFYGTCCQKKPRGGSPEYEAASQCISVKMAELAAKEGMNYALKSLQVAQMVLNQDGSKVLPQHASDVRFLTPPQASLCLEQKRQVPGLSDDILQFIRKKTVMK